jgi:hypothetical protein
MPFAPGQVVLRRYFRRDRYTFVRPMRVVRDDEDGLLLWLTADGTHTDFGPDPSWGQLPLPIGWDRAYRR